MVTPYPFQLSFRAFPNIQPEIQESQFNTNTLTECFILVVSTLNPPLGMGLLAFAQICHHILFLSISIVASQGKELSQPTGTYTGKGLGSANTNSRLARDGKPGFVAKIKRNSCNLPSLFVNHNVGGGRWGHTHRNLQQSNPLVLDIWRGKWLFLLRLCRAPSSIGKQQ